MQNLIEILTAAGQSYHAGDLDAFHNGTAGLSFNQRGIFEASLEYAVMPDEIRFAAILAAGAPSLRAARVELDETVIWGRAA